MEQQFRQYRPPARYPAKYNAPNKKPRRWLVIVGIIGIVIVLALLSIWIISRQRNDDASTNTQSSESFDKTRYSLNDPSSPWIVVNKQRPLTPKTYTPSLATPDMRLASSATAESMQLQPEAAQALSTLADAARRDGVELIMISGYRSYNTQQSTYDSEVSGFGQAIADQESARPGYSEHQTGWAADVASTDRKCEIQACFADTPAGKWLAANAHKYGFVIRYAADKTDITGYVYEPWHLRYVGVDLAAEMYRTNVQTLEEFFDLPAAPTY